MGKNITIIDYGLGNLQSVSGAVKKLGYHPVITREEKNMRSSSKLILPGVGAFGDGMKNIQELGLLDILNELVTVQKKPILGICLGAQLMCNDSSEFGEHKGLGWVDARVVKISTDFETKLKLPHVGWNEIEKKGESLLWDSVPDNTLFYFVHSFKIEAENLNIVKGICHYGDCITAAYESENIFGTQFHPEKSQRWGLKVLENFLKA